MYKRQGYVFDLGGRTLSVREAPGHTPGSVIFVDSLTGNVYSGDAYNALFLLMLPGDRMDAARRFYAHADALLDVYKRQRWPWYGRLYLRLGERALCGQADRIICDSAAIAAHERHSHPAAQTPVIEYGAPLFDPENAPEGGYSEFLCLLYTSKTRIYATI